MFSMWEKATRQLTKTWEDAASRWWDETLREERTLKGMHRMLTGMSFAKARSDRALEDHWARWRLPSAADVERLHERLGEVQQQLLRVEALLEAQSAPAEVIDA